MTPRTARNLLRCVTARRLWNFLKISLSYQLSARTGRSIVWGKPWTLTIEPTNRCNLSCPECPSGNGTMTRAQGLMPYEEFTRLVDEIHPEVFYLQLFFQGEPFIHNRLLDMVRYARAKHMYTAISTNAHYLRPAVAADIVAAGLDRLIVSVDGLTQDVYEQYRVGGNLAKVHEALHNFTAARNAAQRPRTELTLQLLVTRQNEAQLPELRALAKKHGADIALKTMQVYSIEGAEKFLPTDPRYSRYENVDGRLRTRNALHNRCVRLWERSVVTWDGVVVPCCFDKDAEYPLGQLDGRSFADIWRSDTYHDFRRRILRNRRDVPMCRNCTEGLKPYR
ncbi:MAG: radical SAM/SPASM domain-containing protein [Bacteroidota bacterium]|nr:radical SAM/SPASM domain-containing protein [Bacteroidota bacterium]